MRRPDPRPLDPSGARGHGRSFGTFGELLQGALPSGDHFMVTCPLAGWSTATFDHTPDRPGIRVWPAHKEKAARLAELAMLLAGADGGGDLRIDSDLPEGKGMASSSADLVATARAVADAAGIRFAPVDIESLLRVIEPSDGVMYDQIVEFDHRNVRLRARLGTLPPMTIVAHDEGGQVDTISYNNVVRAPDALERREYAGLLAAAREAIGAGDLQAVGQVATRSAELNARRFPRTALQPLLRLRADVDALGVVCAHSGTMLGLLIRHDDREHRAKVESALRACAAIPGSTTVMRSLGDGDDWSEQSVTSAGGPLRRSI